MTTEQLLDLAKTLSAVERQHNLAGPLTDDELWNWIHTNLGLDIPRVSVCEGHQAPFQLLADFYFERVSSAVAVANRGGSKTMQAAILHLLNSKFKRGCESASVGAVESQALRCYQNLQLLLKNDANVDVPDDHPDVTTSIQRETRFKNGSKVEVLVGTINGVNGPHPQKVHADEVELMDPIVFQESRNMSMTKHGIRAQDLITSTRKRAHGPMQAILDEIAEAERAAVEPPYRLYTWCIYEVGENVPNCQVADPRCKNPCSCDRVVKGKWESGAARTFKDVCRGRLARSNGWVPLSDIHKTFRLLGRDMWEAQQECSKPSTEGLVLPTFDRDRHGVKWWSPDPVLGPIFMGVDFGGTNPHAVNWYQLTNREVIAYASHQARSDEPQRYVPAGTRVCFDEIYITEIGNLKLADMILENEARWRRQHPSFRVAARFADPQAKAARLDFVNKGLGTQWYIERDVKEMVKIVRELVEEDQIAVDIVRCPMWCEEAEAWRFPDRRSGFVDDPEIPVDDFNHCMSNFRYVMGNVRALEMRGMRRRGGAPQASDHQHTTASTAGQSPYAPVGGN
jgi:hypothetical protein